MVNIEQDVRTRYLDRLSDSTWIDDDPRMDYGICAIPYFISAFQKESDPTNRARLVRIIWQFRDAAAFATLAAALDDSSDDVWKDALDGLVTLGGDQALTILAKAREVLTANPTAQEKLSWIDEAADQIRQKEK